MPPIIFFLLLSLIPLTVRSEPTSSIIQLPSSQEQEPSDPCSGRPAPATCPVKCFTTDPVCGADGVTYWCGCGDAHCAGARVEKLGFCQVGSDGGKGSVPGQAFLLIHMVWLILLGFSIVFGLL